MSDKSIRLLAVPGCGVFAMNDAGRFELPARFVGCDAGGKPLASGESVPAHETADGRLVASSALLRNAIAAGDLAVASEAPCP